MPRLPSAAVVRLGVPMPPELSEDCLCEAESAEEGGLAGASPSSGSRASSTPPTECAGQYVLEKALGRGGSATVRLARPRGGGPRCAVKALRKECPNARRLAENEVAAMRLLEHDGVCELLDAFEDDECLYVVLEYVEGHELFEEVASEAPMGELRTAEVMRQLLAALQHCHSRGVVHRDLKPENIMVADRRGCEGLQVKLVDFGLSLRQGRQLRGVAGTRPYLAPEALSGHGSCDPALDMWSAGVVLYACLVGEMPPSAVRSGEVPVRAARGWRRARVSRAAMDLVSRLMSPRACERLTAEEASRHPWLREATPVPSAPACAKLLGEQGAVAHIGKELRKEQIIKAVDADKLLGCAEAALGVLDACGTSAVAAGEWLAWLGAAATEAGKESAQAQAAPEPAFGFTIFDGCCAAQAEQETEAISSATASGVPRQPK